jgi:hypothetical protein
MCRIADCLEKQADFTDAASEGFMWGADKGLTFALVAPALVGIVSGAMASKITSPTTQKSELQKSLIAAELEESLAEMKRKQAIAKAKETMNVGPTERSLHM